MVKYIDIADDIRSKIFDKKYTYGQKLPYEYVLCVAYHCNKETMKKRMESYIKKVLSFCQEKYPGVVYAWDVVNEACDDGGGYRTSSLWFEILGEESDIEDAVSFA